MAMKAFLWLRGEIGAIALAAFALIAVAGAIHLIAVQPLQARADRLEREQAGAERRSVREGILSVSLDAPGKLAAFYEHFERAEDRIEWLAKLYGHAAAAGLDLRAAEYRLAEPRRRIERYQVSLPVAGTYAQVRTFLESALADIPVLSLDQVTFRRRNAHDARIDAEVLMTLHLIQK